MHCPTLGDVSLKKKKNLHNMSSQLKRKNKSISKVIKTTSFKSKLPPIKHVNTSKLAQNESLPLDTSAISSSLPPYAILPQQDVDLTESHQNQLFPQYSQYTLDTLPDLISAIAENLWEKVEDPKEAGKPFMQEIRHFQQKLPHNCVLKSHLMGTIGLEDATALDRRLAQLSFQEGAIWVTTVDVQDVKEVVILASSFFRHLDDLCHGPKPGLTTNAHYLHDLTRNVFEEFFLASSKRRDSAGSTDLGQYSFHTKQATCPDPVLIYQLFREFLLTNPGIRIVCRDDLVEFEVNFFKTHYFYSDEDGSTDAEYHSRIKSFIDSLLLKRESLLWQYSNLLVNTGYLTLQVAQTLKTSFTSLPDYPYTSTDSSPSSSSKKKSDRFLQEQYIMNEQYRLNDDNSNIPMDGISSINHSDFNNTSTAANSSFSSSDNETEELGTFSIQKKNEPLFRISIPNIGNLLNVTRSARRWVLDSILGHKTVSTKMSSFGSPTRKVSPLFHTPPKQIDNDITTKKLSFSKYSLVTQSKFKQMTNSDLYERWNNKRVHNKVSFYKNFKGINLETVLLDCFGGGWIEPLPTPVGTCWRYTGKAIST